MSDDRSVPGYCPMGCGQTLFTASEGYITCSYLECPCPDAVSKILDEREHEHIVVFKSGTFTVRHPLRERIGSQLEDCQLAEWIRRFDGPPAKPGIYRATENAGWWKFAEVPHE